MVSIWQSYESRATPTIYAFLTVRHKTLVGTTSISFLCINIKPTTSHKMERKLETIELTHQGKTTVWDVVEDAERYEGKRAYMRGSTLYYDMAKFEAGLAKADSFTRTSANL